MHLDEDATAGGAGLQVMEAQRRRDGPRRPARPRRSAPARPRGPSAHPRPPSPIRRAPSTRHAGKSAPPPGRARRCRTATRPRSAAIAPIARQEVGKVVQAIGGDDPRSGAPGDPALPDHQRGGDGHRDRHHREPDAARARSGAALASRPIALQPISAGRGRHQQRLAERDQILGRSCARRNGPRPAASPRRGSRRAPRTRPAGRARNRPARRPPRARPVAASAQSFSADEQQRGADRSEPGRDIQTLRTVHVLPPFDATGAD